MYTATFTLTADCLAAARALAAAMRANHIEPPELLPLADAVAAWAVAEAETLVTEAASIYTNRSGDANRYSRLMAAIAAARGRTSTAPLPLRQRRKRARAFARAHNTRVEAWMLHDQWIRHIGCAICDKSGPAAACWGATGCHGYLANCGCRQCVSQHEPAPSQHEEDET